MRSHSRLTAHQSRKFIERKQMRSAIVLTLIIVSTVSWIFALSRCSMLDILTINTIEINGVDSLIAGNLQTAARNILKGDYLGLFSRSNVLLYPRNGILAAAYNSSPRVDAVNIAIKGINSLNITIKEKTPAAVVCDDLPEFSSNELALNDLTSCYFADAKGYMYGRASVTLNNPYHRYYIPAITESDAVIGSYAIPAESFDSLQKFYDSVADAGISILAILVKGNGEYELYAENPAAAKNIAATEADTTVVYFNNSRPLTEELANLIAFWKHMTAKMRTSGKRVGFEYVDVRYGSNVFYREIQ